MRLLQLKLFAALATITMLAGCLETTTSPTTPSQSTRTVNSTTIAGSYRFNSECGMTGNFLKACQNSGFSINQTGRLSGVSYSGLDPQKPYKIYSISFGQFSSDTRTETLLGSGRKVQYTRHIANFSGSVSVNGQPSQISGRATFDPSTKVISFDANGTANDFRGHQISRDGTTYWQRRSEEARLADEQNVREIQQSRQAAATVAAVLGNNQPSAGSSNVESGRGNAQHCVSARLTQHKGVELTNSCGYSVKINWCQVSGNIRRWEQCPSVGVHSRHSANLPHHSPRQTLFSAEGVRIRWLASRL